MWAAARFGAITGILAAVIHRQQTGEGQLVDISMFDGAVAWNAHRWSAIIWSGGPRPGVGNHAAQWRQLLRFLPYRDGRYLSVGSLELKFWQGFCQAIERPDLIEGWSRSL